ncbi:MAG: hypothetical protein Tsb0027_23360 [Wenzhouxiangellaceae bacterium]
MRLIPFFALVGALLLPGTSGYAQSAADAEPRGEYRVTMLRAAPGKWVAMKALIEGQGEAGVADQNGRIASYRMRHAQGAQWDFMLIQPIEGLHPYFSAEVQALEADFRHAIAELADFEEDWVVEGPAHATLKQAYPAAGAFLIEMFRARAGMQQALFDSRVKENRFLAKIDTPTNFVFSGYIGADWDVMTIGFYRDFAHWGTAGNEHAAAAQEQAARDVGFSGVAELAPGLRELLTQHQDTLASAMD